MDTAGTAQPSSRPAIAPTMRAARVHGRGSQMRIDRVPTPTPRPGEVLVEVRASDGIVPNVKNVLQYGDDFIAVQPPKPAIFGLDVAGVIVVRPG